MAQVYSLNVVGYYNVTVAANSKQMIANQLNTTNNTVGALIPNGPPNAYVYKYSGGAFQDNKFDDVDLVWAHPEWTLNPGEAMYYYSPAATTLTFVGEVLQGNLANNLPIDTKVFRSSMVPQAGTPVDFNIPGEANDYIYTWNGSGYDSWKFDDVDLAWPSGLSLKVGEGFFYLKYSTSVSTSWVRNFTVQ